MDKASFFVKDLEPGTPPWLARVQIRHGSGPKFYPVFDTPAALAWLGQVAALELHVPQWRVEQPAGPRVATSRSAEQYPDRVVFDLLAANGVDLRGRRFDHRRAELQALTTWSPPMQLSPITDDLDTAKNWLAKYAAAGIEGVVAKGAATTYRGGVRGWQKFKHQTTEEAVIVAVIGPITRPESIVVGRYTHSGQMVIVGRSMPLSSAQFASLGAVLVQAGSGHPWPDTIVSSRFGAGRDRVRLTKVEPTVVAEVRQTSPDRPVCGGTVSGT